MLILETIQENIEDVVKDIESLPENVQDDFIFLKSSNLDIYNLTNEYGNYALNERVEFHDNLNAMNKYLRRSIDILDEEFSQDNYNIIIEKSLEINRSIDELIKLNN